jgi:predicted PhzF superfamily epimerase YddE/YHI9
LKEIKIYQVDAFTSRLFGGNPAAVCPLREWLADDVLQMIAAENNLSETAFFIPEGDGFELRWFTPKVEIDMCGHATLATSHVIFNHLHYPQNEIRFSTRFVGPLSVNQHDRWLTLNFPSWIATPVAPLPEHGVTGLGGLQPKECYVKRDYMFVYEREEDIRNVKPDFTLLGKLGRYLCITAPGKDCDFVSRFFCAGDGIEEDPVTGSAHSMLIPYWTKRLGKTQMLARQLSERGGELHCEFLGERVLIGGQAETYMQGKIFLPETPFTPMSKTLAAALRKG